MRHTIGKMDFYCKNAYIYIEGENGTLTQIAEGGGYSGYTVVCSGEEDFKSKCAEWASTNITEDKR